jgi:hypothetical protein
MAKIYKEIEEEMEGEHRVREEVADQAYGG